MKKLISKIKDMKNKKNLSLLLVAGITLIIVTLGATYAYFQAQGNRGANIDTNIITGTTDLLSFKFGDEINIQANQDNFGAGMGNLSDSTTGTALLRAGDTTNNVDATYNIYLIIESNNFEYTTENQTPEILLNVTDPNGNPVENITGLVHYEDGFDITTRTGGFLLVPDYQISATNISETIQDWNIEVTFVNLDSDQNANTGKTLTGKLYMTQEQMSSYELTQINNIDSSTTYNSITVTPEITNGSGAVDKYYYGIEEATSTMAYTNNTNQIKRLSNTYAAVEDVSFIESDSPNYQFTNLKSNTEYTIYSYVVDENKIKSNVYSTNVTTSEYEVPVINNVSHEVTLNSISLTVDASNGSNAITKYMYSKDNGASWEESTSNTHTFTNLTDSTEYDIKVKVVDSEGYKSTEYYEAITTEVYILPVVTSVNAETTWNSITLTPSGTNGTNAIDHYEYSINNGAYQSSNVFNSLNENTDYTIKVKAIDSIGRESNVYETTVRTDTYKLPTISVSTSATENSITVRVNATPGDGSIVSYHYSRDDGSNYTSSSNSSHTFSGLASGTTYYLKVYVTDSNGRTSAVTSKTQATTYVNPSVSRVTASNITSDSITINITASGGSNSISRYYYSSNNGASWVNSTSSSYTFTGLSAGTKYNFKVYVKDTAGHQSSQKSVSAETDNPTLANVCSEGANLANCIKEYNTMAGDGAEGIYYHDGQGTYTNADQEVGDNSYRFSGADPNNYVCFGSDEETCPEENLYRIIGVFDGKVKLIKADYTTSTMLGTDGRDYYGAYSSATSNYKGSMDTSTIAGYRWNYDTSVSTSGSNNWTTSEFNTINLNTNYWNYLGSTWQNLIATTTWYLGGMTPIDNTAKEFYDGERNNAGYGSNPTTYTDEIGLMYPSDYGYAADPSYWTIILNASSSTINANNWLYMGLYEWTITPRSSSGGIVFHVDSIGGLFTISASFGYAARPVFYLKSNVALQGGSGTSSDPYRLAV